MYTGASKKAVVIKTAKNSIFEEAYFILKDNAELTGESEMIREANKLLKKHFPESCYFENGKKQTKKKQGNCLTAFLVGALVSFILCTLLFLVAK